MWLKRYIKYPGGFHEIWNASQLECEKKKEKGKICVSLNKTATADLVWSTEARLS